MLKYPNFVNFLLHYKIDILLYYSSDDSYIAKKTCWLAYVSATN